MAFKARTDGLIVKEFDGELAIYDPETHQAHELNRSAATVWRHCDGETSVAEMAAAIASDSDLPADEGIAEIAIGQLGRAGLLEGPPAYGAAVSRRQVIRRLGLAGTVALMLPTLSTIVAPTPAMAQSVRGTPGTPGTPGPPPTPPPTPA